MTTAHKVNLLLYILFVTIYSVRGHCDDSFNPLQCAFDFFCQTQFDSEQPTEYYEFGSQPHIISSCKPINIYINSYDQRDCYPIHLIYKGDVQMNYDNSEFDGYIPPMGSDSSLFQLVTHMDISDNNYEIIPNIRVMDNLAVLILSNNLLTVATLANPKNLPSLVEINLSHNTISEIQYDLLNYIVYSRLRKIDLSYNSLTKISEAVFDPFNELETLDISHNFIDTLSPITFDGIKQLLHLNISYNRISDINSSLFRFNEIKLLDLSNNKIKAIKVSDFKKLTNLEILDLNSNYITLIEKDIFHNMDLLNSLYLNNNKLDNIDKEMFNNNSNLVSIDISENNLKALPRGLFKSKQIHYFSINDNQLEGSIDKGTFEGLVYVTKLDLSSQSLDSIKDYSFSGLKNLVVLLLNDNKIQNLSSKCFRMMQSLKRLDLSSNKIANIAFEKDDLFNLYSLSLRKNHLTAVKQENFIGLNSLQYLDLSDNKITQVETKSFKSLKELINFEISNNPLSGTLEESTFDGLNSLPSLDISCTLLSTVENGSFIGMSQLKNLNVSHSKINTLEYNTFVHTGAIETIDLSFNELEEFNINSTELICLDTLYLNNNLIKMIDSYTLRSISRLTKLNLSYNKIQNIYDNTFTNLKFLRMLDISYNLNLKITLSILKETKNVNVLNLSGVKTGITFGNLKDISLTQLIISNSSVSDLKTLQMNELRHLETLSLIYNNISKLETGAFCNISSLKNLDVSHNKIIYIQPGVFKDNTMLLALNLSHNSLSSISYGIFRGLTHLHTLDISFNSINDLQNERFYEVKSLSVLIVDHNKIESINAEQFLGTSLTQLSIGENPIPCEVLVKLKRNGIHFLITATRLDENNDENVDGVTCNKKSHMFDRITNVGTPNMVDNAKILLSIRDILIERYKNHQSSNDKPTTNLDEKYFSDVTNQIKKSSSDINQTLSTFYNSMMGAMAKTDDTNILLNKILKVLTLKSITKAPPVQVTKDNATYENLLSYINKKMQDLEETVESEKSSILNEMETKISAVKSQVNTILLSTELPKHEKLSASAEPNSIFTESCVALILIILVCFIMFKVYKSGIFVRQRFSVSTRELPGDMDSTL